MPGIKKNDKCMGQFETYRQDGKTYMLDCGGTNIWGQSQLCPNCENNTQEVEAHRRRLANAEADNAWLRSAGWGEM